jgi:hypothetical protein
MPPVNGNKPNRPELAKRLRTLAATLTNLSEDDPHFSEIAERLRKEIRDIAALIRSL